MEAINGVTFRDYACANANLVAGMSEEKICEVLGIEQPVWKATQDAWNNKMAELSHEDMAFYGEAFTNPKQGKFADVEGGATGPEEVLSKYPEWSDTIKMAKYMEHASNVGVDIDFDKEFDINLTQYTQLASYWSGFYRKNVIDIQSKQPEDYSNGEWENANNLHAEFNALNNKWDAFYMDKYKDQNADLSDDIDF